MGIFSSLCVIKGWHPAPAADLIARRIRERERKRRKNVATVLKRVKTAAGVTVPKAKRARKKGRRARRIPGPGLVPAPGLVQDQKLKIAPGSLSPSSPKATTKAGSPRGPLTHVLAPPLKQSPELGLSPNPSPVPPRPLKLAPTPALPRDPCPAPSPVPSLVLAPVPAPSSDFRLWRHLIPPLSFSYIPQTLQHYPASCF